MALLAYLLNIKVMVVFVILELWNMGLRLDFILTALINPIWALFGFLYSPYHQETVPVDKGIVKVKTIFGVQKGVQFEVALPKYNDVGLHHVKREFHEDFLTYFEQTEDNVNEDSVYYTMSYDSDLCNGGAITVGMKFENTVTGEYFTPDLTHFTVQEVIEVPAQWFIANGCDTSD